MSDLLLYRSVEPMQTLEKKGAHVLDRLAVLYHATSAHAQATHATPIPDLHTLVAEAHETMQTVCANLTISAQRLAKIARQEAAGGLPWLAIRAVLYERGFTHVETMGGALRLETWEGPYGNDIPHTYRGLLQPTLGPGVWSDCADSADSAGVQSPYAVLGVWRCTPHEEVS